MVQCNEQSDREFVTDGLKMCKVQPSRYRAMADSGLELGDLKAEPTFKASYSRCQDQNMGRTSINQLLHV